MSSTSPVDQNTLWNGPGGQIWVEQQAILDGLFQPMADLLAAELPQAVTQLLDIGCGTGASLLAAAAARPVAHCTGWTFPRPCWRWPANAPRPPDGRQTSSLPMHSGIRCLPRTSTGSSRGWV